MTPSVGTFPRMTAIALRFLIGSLLITSGLRADQPRPIRQTTAPSTAAARDLGPRSAHVEPWRPIFSGVDYARAEAATPRPVKVHAVRIDLKARGIEFLVTSPNGDEPLDTNGMWTSKFLKTYTCQVALNASPFQPVVEREGVNQNVCGLSMSRGDCYSPADKMHGVLLISKDNKAWIATPPVNLGKAWNGVGGFNPLLKASKNVAADDALHPRSAVGISRDGRFLYLVAIDGRQAGYSEGTTTGETAEWMRRFGAYDALNLDGGGSTALVISDGHGGAKVLNRPINLGIPGMERVSANHLGVFARPLEK